MVLCIKVAFKDAQKVKEFIISNNLFSPDFTYKKDGEYILFPIVAERPLKKKFKSVTFVDVDGLRPARKDANFKAAVKNSLSDEELAILRRAFDIVGSIAILDIPPELENKERLLAETILRLHKNITTVVKKAGIHGTEFRTQPMKYLAGIDTKETIYKETGIRLKLDIEQVYFSARLSNERERVAKLVKPGESVLVMFSGCAPYPCVIARNSKAKDILGIELNPAGHKYGLENIKLNHLKNVELINGDVKKIVPELKRKFDRIVMPLPKSAGDFLEAAFAASKSGTVIHFYSFEKETEFDSAEKRILEACKKNDLKCKIIETVKCGQQSPGVFRICVDFRIV